LIEILRRNKSQPKQTTKSGEDGIEVQIETSFAHAMGKRSK